MITLDALAQTLEDSRLLQVDTAKAAQIELVGADCDSRQAKPGHLFICKGKAFNPKYLVDALSSGAVAYMCEEALVSELAQLAPNAPGIAVSDIRAAMAKASPLCWGNPTQDSSVFALGITGTKGKSTAAYMLRNILQEAKHPAAIMGSIDTDDGIEHFESVNTTPEAPDLWRHFANCKKSNTPYMAMEVSSQALKYERVEGVQFEVAAFLNIGKDHISPAEHPNFEDYFESKLTIFDQCKCAVINLDSDNIDTILKRSKTVSRRLVYTLDPDVAEGYFGYCGEVKDLCLWADDICPTEAGTSFCVHTPTWCDRFEIAMIGRFNVENAMCAITMTYDQGIDKEDMKRALAKTTVPGRMKLISTHSQRVNCVVDYAHNALSFENFFQSMKEHFGRKKLIAVFGAPGDKAYERRRELPKIAARFADYIIYTTEDPAHDPIDEILDALESNTPDTVPHARIADRASAIDEAVRLAKDMDGGAVVCLLAKGEENYQHIGDEYVPCKQDGELFLEAAAKYNL